MHTSPLCWLYLLSVTRSGGQYVSKPPHPSSENLATKPVWIPDPPVD